MVRKLQPRIPVAIIAPVACALLLAAAAAAQAAEYRSKSYVGSYNELVRMLCDRHTAAGRSLSGLVLKDPASTDPSANSISQADLHNLRAKTVTLLKTWYTVPPEDFATASETAAEAFTNGYPRLMWNVGNHAGLFTKVPGEHCASGQTIYTNDFSDAPILPIHLWELYDVVRRMRFARATGYTGWTSNGEKNELVGGTGGNTTTWVEARLFAELNYAPLSRNNQPTCGSRGSNTSYLYTAAIWRRYACFLQEGVPAASHIARFYYFAGKPGGVVSTWDDCGDGLSEGIWSVWDTQGPTSSVTHLSVRLGSLYPLPAWCAQPVENSTALGYSVLRAAVILEFDKLYDSPPEVFFDGPEWQCDGYQFMCRECAPGINVKLDERSGKPVVSMPAGIPDGMQTAGERLPAFFTESFIDGLPRLNYSPDTRLLGVCSNTAEGWEYVVIARPSGAEVAFAMDGTMAGSPVEPFEQQPCKVTQDGGDYLLNLNDGRDIAYRFDAAGAAQEIRIAPGHHEVSAPVTSDNWLGVTATRSNNRVSNVTSPAMSTQVSYAGNGAASEIKYFSPSGTPLSSVAMSMDGTTRVYKEKDASGTLVRETRIVQAPGRTELWRGREEATGFTGTRELRSSVYVLNTGHLVQTVTNMYLRAGETPLVSVRNQVFKWNGRGFQLVAETNGVPESAATWSAYDRYTAPGPSGRLGLLKETRDSDGSWTRYLYDRYDRVTTERGPFSSGASDSSDDELRVARNYYAGDTNMAALGFPGDDVAARHDTRPRLMVGQALGSEVSRTYVAYLPDRMVTKQCAVPGARYDNADLLTTATYCFTNGQFEGRTRLIEHSDGTRSVFLYSYESGPGHTTTTVLRGAGEGESVTDGTRTVSTADSAGRAMEERSEDIASGLVLSRVVHYRDAAGRDICTSNAVTGTFSTRVYGCCGPEQLVDEAGIETTRDYDPLGRVMAEHRLGVMTFYEYDTFGNIVAQTVSAGIEPAATTRTVYDAAGRRVLETDAAGNVTATTYSTNRFGGRTVAATYPDGSTRSDEFFADGRPASESGTAAYPLSFLYGVTTQGEFSVQYMGADTNAPEWVRTESDLLGRTVRTVRPNGYSVRSVYDSLGRELEQTDETWRNLSEYNALGERFRTAADINTNGIIDLAGPDRVSEAESSVENYAGKACRVSRQYVYPDDGSSERVLVSESFAAVDGSESWQVSFGRTNRSSVTWNRSAASRVETSVAPDGVGESAVYTNGLLRKRARLTATGEEFACVTFAYDALGRQSAVFSTAANGELVTTRFAYDALGRLTNTTASAGGNTRNASDQFDSMGRRVRAVLPDGATQEFVYDTRGNLICQSGARQYPVTYTYTDQGRMATMSTYRSGLAGPPDTTTWQYDQATGLLVGKQYPSDPSHLSYSHTPSGQLATRTWARGVETRYVYNDAGELTRIDYSGSTPDVSFTYDRLGRQATVTDGNGACSFAYDAQLQLASETRVSTLCHPPSTNVLTRSYDPHGRPSGFSLFSASDLSDPSYRSDYSYDPAGRLSGVAGSGVVAAYRYGADGGTITGRVVTANGSPVLATATARDWLGRITSARTEPLAGEVLGNNYKYNNADQRISNELADGSRWTYRYDNLGQVISGRKHFADGVPVGGAQFDYSFDTIGNRVSARNFMGQRTKTESYTANALNQYEQRTVPGQVWVSGEAAPEARVTARVDEARPVLANRHGEYFWAAVSVSNELGLVFSTNLTITAALPVPAISPTGLLVRTEARNCVVSGTPERFTYDPDGNLLSDGIWSYTWDAENRLIQVSNFQRRVSFSYDYMGRRICKTVSQWNTHHWSLVTTVRLVIALPKVSCCL
jgi:YD repeat-containing protein